MCGIIGYKGARNGVDVSLQGLKSLEYRGYDSWGLAAVNGRDDNIQVLKETGKIGDIDRMDMEVSGANISVGHTRWATHGQVTKVNAHPHLSGNREIAVVHNGIIENFQSLRRFLETEGCTFVSETDTEIIPHYIQYFMGHGVNFPTAVCRTLNKIEGSVAIVAFNRKTRELIGARRGSPLVMGMGKDEYFLASDIPAFLKFTKKVIYLEDNEMVSINRKVTFYNIDTEIPIKEKRPTTVSWSLEQAQKGNYPHFMLKEIHEQAFTIEKAAQQPRTDFRQATAMLKKAKGVFFIGCGTSYHACVSAAYTFARAAGIHVNVVLGSEFRHYEKFLTDKTLVVALSQSGETADLLDAIRTAKDKGCKTLSVVNVMGSTLTRLADLNLMMNAGPEICVLSTKSYTSQLTILMLLAYAVADRLHEGRQIIRSVSHHVKPLIENNLKPLKALAEKLKDSRDLFLIGRDLAFPTALEGALKIKEVSYIHAEGFAGAELKHGTIALIEDGVPVIALATPDTRSLILGNANEVKARGAHLIGMDMENDGLYDDFIQVPDAGAAAPILMIIPIQILSYYLALARGCDPDKPRNLAKSVTVK
jgi:glucosamine--fructose-6-phosphate aminotransferase (isomerizing)